jgi:hypothetical protein
VCCGGPSTCRRCGASAAAASLSRAAEDATAPVAGGIERKGGRGERRRLGFGAAGGGANIVVHINRQGPRSPQVVVYINRNFATYPCPMCSQPGTLIRPPKTLLFGVHNKVREGKEMD